MDIKPIPLGSPGETRPSDPAGGPGALARKNAEREFQAMLLREMLRPLTEALFSGKGGFSEEGAGPLGATGNDTYAYFLEGALSHQLSQSWPLPNPFGDPPTAPLPGSTLPFSRGPLPISLDRARDAARIPAPSSTTLPAPTMTTQSTAQSRSGSHAIAAALSAARSRSGSDAIPAALAAAQSPKGPAPTPAETGALPEAQIRRAARLFELPENLVRAVVLTESGGRADAVSSKGAVGYMQVLPSTAWEMGVGDVRDPWQNVYAGTKYLRRQMDRFGNLEHALAAYNAGPGAVSRHGGVPPYRETHDYIERVLAWKARLDHQGS